MPEIADMQYFLQPQGISAEDKAINDRMLRSVAAVVEGVLQATNKTSWGRVNSLVLAAEKQGQLAPTPEAARNEPRGMRFCNALRCELKKTLAHCRVCLAAHEGALATSARAMAQAARSPQATIAHRQLAKAQAHPGKSHAEAKAALPQTILKCSKGEQECADP